MCRVPFTNWDEEGSGVNRKRVLDRRREEQGLPSSTPLDSVRDRLLEQIADAQPADEHPRPARGRSRSARGDDAEGHDFSDFAGTDGGGC